MKANETYSGMTQREYFAIMALNGLIASGWGGSISDVKHAVELSVQASDSLIQELKK